MQEHYPIKPLWKGLSGNVSPQLWGTKSITNRALILAALRNGRTRVEGAAFCDDTELMVECLRQAGYFIRKDFGNGCYTVYGEGRNMPYPEEPEEYLYVKNAGTVARFLPALLALQHNGTYHFSALMDDRPMKELFEALMQLGCSFIWEEDEWQFPFTMFTRGESITEDTVVNVDISKTTQALSALLLIQSVAKFQINITGDTGISKPYIDMTHRMIEQFNEFEDGKDVTYVVEEDFSAFANFAMLPVIHSGIVFPKEISPHGQRQWLDFDINRGTPPDQSLQGDIQFYNTLEKHGILRLEKEPGSLTVYAGESRQGIDVDFREFSDCFPAFAILAPFLDTPSTIRGIKHTRKQECDRVAVMAENLEKVLGEGFVETTDDSITIKPIPKDNKQFFKDRVEKFGEKDGTFHIRTDNDHRIAMAFSILGTYPSSGRYGDENEPAWITIDDPDCCDKSCPEFYQELGDIDYYFREPFGDTSLAKLLKEIYEDQK